MPSHLCGLRQQAPRVTDYGVQGDIEPAADGVVGRVLPRLQAIAVREIVRGFPVVEGLIAVLNGRKEGGDQAGSQEDVEGLDGLDGIRAAAPSTISSSAAWRGFSSYFFFFAWPAEGCSNCLSAAGVGGAMVAGCASEGASPSSLVVGAKSGPLRWAHRTPVAEALGELAVKTR